MKIFNLVLIFFAFGLISSCQKEGHNHDGDEQGFEYHAHIHTPTSDNKKMGNSLDIKIDFESHSQKTVHHVNVSIARKDDPTKVIYSKPDDAHVHESSGKFEFTDAFMLEDGSGFEGHTDYVLTAKVWGHEAGAAEISETVEFHVHPE